MRRVQNDTSSTSQAVRNLATNPEMVAAASDKILHTNLSTNPSFETAGISQNVRTNILTNPSFETAGSLFTTRTNLAQNPSFEATSGTVNVRTNLSTNPSMETSGSSIVVRTNLAVDPNATSTTYWTNIASTAHTRTVENTIVHSGTSAIKVTMTASGNMGSKSRLEGGVLAGETYSWSVWIYLSRDNYIRPYWERSTPTYAGAAAGGAVFVSANTWTKITGTYTFNETQADASGIFAFGFFNDGTIPWSIGDTIISDECLIEKLPITALGGFFSGSDSTSGDFNYAWTGAVNASSSQQRSVAVANRTGLNPVSVAWQSGVRARSGTKSAAFMVLSNDPSSGTTLWYPTPDYTIGTSLTANTVYTWSVYVWVPAGCGPVRLCDAGGAITYGAPSTLTEQWERLSVTFTSQAGSGPSYMRIRPAMGSSIPAGSVIYVDNEQLELGAVASPYFDGSTPATPDLTHVWGGSVNASISHAQAPAVTYWSNRWFGNGGGNGVLYQNSGGMSGGKCVRKLWTVANTTAPMDSGISTIDIPVTAGSDYTLSAYVRPSLAQHFTPFVIWKDSNLVALSNTAASNPSTPVPAGIWTRVSSTQTAPANAAFANFVIGPYHNSVPMPAGSYLDFDNVLVEQAALLKVYFDGNNPIRNLADNPNLEINTDGWASNNGIQSPVARSTVHPIRGTASLVATRTASSPNTVVSSIWANGKSPVSLTSLKVSPGQVVSFSLDVRVTNSDRKANTYFGFRDAAGNVVGGALGSADTTLIAGKAVRAGSAGVIVPANADSMLCVCTVTTTNGANALTNETVTYDGLLIEESATISPYYYEGTDDYTYSWSGTVNATSSLQRAMSPAGVSSVSYLSHAIQSTSSVSGGSKSLRIVPVSASNDSFAELSPQLQSVGYTFKANTTYTLSADRTIFAPLTGNFSPNLIRANIGTELTPTVVVQPANTAGTSRMVVRFTTGATTALNFLRLYAASSYGNGEVWYDNVVLEEGLTTGTYFDGSTPAYKNLCTNPSFETNVLDWTTVSATLVRVTNQGNDGHVGELTQTISNGTRISAVWNPGITFGADTYTVAFDMKGTDASLVSARGLLYDSVAAVSRGSALVAFNKDGNYNRYSFTITADGPFDRVYMEVQGVSIPLGTKVWIDRALVEKGSTTGDYYAGSGDFTYSWATTAHASMSYARAMSVSGASTASNIIQSSEWSTRLGTKSLRIIANGTSADTFASFGGDTGALRWGMQAGKTYTAMAKIRLTAPLTGTLANNRHLRIVPFTKAAVGQPYVEWPSNIAPNSAGVATLKTTFTLPSDATEAFIRLYNGASGAKGEVWYDDFLLVEGAYNGDYFDGSTPATPDFTHFWTGSVDGSTSTRRVKNVAGVYNNHRSNVYSSSVAPFSGSSTAKGVVTQVGYLPRYEQVLTPIPGRRYTVMAKMRASAGPVSLGIKWTANPDAYPPILSESASNGYWTTVKVSDICPPDATAMNLWIGVPTNTALGTEFEIDQLMIVSKEYNGPFGTGDSYGWEWEGTPHASTSIGYPVGMPQLAGKPLFFQTAAGMYVLTNVDPAKNTLAANHPRTIYTIVDNILELPTNSLDVVSAYGVDDLSDVVANKYITIRQQSQSGEGSNSLLSRRTGGGGAVAIGVPATGKQVLISGLDANGYMFAAHGKNALVTDSVAMTVPHERIQIYPDSIYHKHIATYIFPGVHSSAVRQEMVKLLAHEYAIPGM